MDFSLRGIDSLLNKEPLFLSQTYENEESSSSQITILETFILSPTKRITKITDIRKRHLDQAKKNHGITGSPFKKKTRILSIDSPIAQRVVQEMIKQGSTTGRNGALIIARDPETDVDVYSIALTNGAPSSHKHAEKRAYDLLPDKLKTDPNLIKMVYSLRAPCQHGCHCHHSLKLVTGPRTQIAYTMEYSISKTQRHKSEKVLRALLAEQGVRDASTGGLKRKQLETGFVSDSEFQPKKLKFK